MNAPSAFRKNLLRAVAILLGLVCLLAGGTNLMNYRAFDHWGLASAMMLLACTINFIAAVLVLVPRWRWYGGLVLVGLMAGPLATHLGTGNLGMLSVPLILGSLAFWLVVCEWPASPGDEQATQPLPVAQDQASAASHA